MQSCVTKYACMCVCPPIHHWHLDYLQFLAAATKASPSSINTGLTVHQAGFSHCHVHITPRVGITFFNALAAIFILLEPADRTLPKASGPPNVERSPCPRLSRRSTTIAYDDLKEQVDAVQMRYVLLVFYHTQDCGCPCQSDRCTPKQKTREAQATLFQRLLSGLPVK